MVGKIGRSARGPRSVSDRFQIPDYSKLRACEAEVSELAPFGVANVPELVDKMNREFIQNGFFPITQSDYPSTKKRLEKLIVRWERTFPARKDQAA